MKEILNCEFGEGVTGRVISPDDGGQYFFGYYDLQPYSEDGKKHLANRVEFNDRLPTEKDIAQLGYIEDGKFICVSETTAWNFQQGALLQWYDEDSVIHNHRDGDGFCSVIKNIRTQTTKRFSMPLANLSLDKRYGLAINFGRIFAYRPGYGYDGLIDEGANVNAPENDGVFLVDTLTGKSDLILSYKRIQEEFVPDEYKNSKILINHITFNPSSQRFLMLVRTFQIAPDGQLTTMLLTSDKEGKDVRKLTEFQINSHYFWKNDEEFMIWSRLDDGFGLYYINDRTGEIKKSGDPLLDERDFHCSYTPDRKLIVGDTYPRNYYDSFLRHDFATGTTDVFLKIRRNSSQLDIRCDNHARCNQSGTKMSFDAWCCADRQICEIEGFNPYIK